jgi:transcriptional regulator with XRE-family HTH domain
MTQAKYHQKLVAFGATVRAVRKERRQSVADFAASAGIEREQLRAIEAGRYDPVYDVLLDLARSLDIKASTLVSRADGMLVFAQGAAFGRRLRRLRTERGITQDRLAQITGLHRTTIGLWERGEKEPRLATILRLAHGIDVTPDKLVMNLDADDT